MPTEKQQRNRKKFTREYKVREIQKNITKKTRLRKNYFKALKEEGYTVPEKPEHDADKTKANIQRMKQEKVSQGKMKFDEKKEMKRQRQRSKREEEEARRQRQLDRLKESKAKHIERENRSKRLTQKTRSGQPLMGPKIGDLLEKIKTDDTYTA
ncbi:Fyv7p KNAG_0L00230 [Huiozyma naganishii CBS 8797]|uniref:rRNA-processing protein FYV7 n=1 Tax=Huiozyma naganishii (strain ATCC MYA-139 / BCRC 22969 / CBS 8797 / KCTC 17520 / NBRC 10181 / NCYC 3082 / Yp74L-3) TaxID=1071383 RepID=J7SB13_HUIN7|nr:hypothetical protein KNAG_0L00230 [Kazachstania naganishii CBS 8797]CCK72646.1 hypothetical protein KNAG_0L00230 [Kazachstania naganishii CBS 8797]